MRTRGAILATLVLGFMMSTTGAGLAVSGFMVTGQASQTQYPTPPAPTGPAPTAHGPTGEAPNQGGKAPGNEVLGGTERGGGGANVQPTRQVTLGAQETSSSLPFTGFAAIPVLLIGIALLCVGFVMRRAPRRN